MSETSGIKDFKTIPFIAECWWDGNLTACRGKTFPEAIGMFTPCDGARFALIETKLGFSPALWDTASPEWDSVRAAFGTVSGDAKLPPVVTNPVSDPAWYSKSNCPSLFW